MDGGARRAMTPKAQRQGRAVCDQLALLGTFARYWVTIFPIARRELAHWRERAERIPDPTLRGLARHTLSHERLNSEGAALFAILAPRIRRPAVVRLLVAFQVMYDYLDVVTEQPVPDPLGTSRRLHRALTVALGQPPPKDGYYTDEVHGADGGYLDELVASCRLSLVDLPRGDIAVPFAAAAARRSAEGQSQSHAAVLTPSRELVGWASSAGAPSLHLRWWETAAASESSLVIHALLASGADPAFTSSAADRIAATYWPWVTGLNALLDDVVDRAEDIAEGTHSYAQNYASNDEMTCRVIAMARRATAAIRGLPQARRHAVIVAAMTSFYLSAPEARRRDVEELMQGVRSALDVEVRLLLAMLRIRRWFARGWKRSRSECSHHA